MQTNTLLNAIAQACCASRRCIASNNDYAHKWDGRIKELTDKLPHGSGFDSGCQIDVDATTATRVVIHTSFHHMDENGFYDGWTDHTVIARPDFEIGFRLSISGRDRNGWKDYAYDVFSSELSKLYSTPEKPALTT